MRKARRRFRRSSRFVRVGAGIPVGSGAYHRRYRGHVDSEINDQYRTLTGSLRFLNNIVRFPGCGNFDAQASFVVCQRRTRTLIGLILCSQCAGCGHITQVCVLPNTARRAWRSDDGGLDQESPGPGIPVHVADGDGSE